MKRKIYLKNKELKKIRSIDPRLVSYNIEMTEITGGTFWKSYTPGQIAGTEDFPKISSLTDDFTSMAGLMEYYPPINLYDESLRAYAKVIGPAWIRVSGSWATKTYYDFEEKTKGKPPKGYNAVLTSQQWMGVLDFVKAVDGKLLISVSNCEGDHPNGGALDLTQTKKVFDFSHNYGVDIDAAEFMNEPNMMTLSGAPKGYTPDDYARDQDIFNAWVKENYPNCLLVGPCTTGDPTVVQLGNKGMNACIADMIHSAATDELMNGTKIPLDVFSYHCYNNVSEHIASAVTKGYWLGNEAHTDNYLAVAPDCAKGYIPFRDKYAPGGQMWVTESGDSCGGGSTWASTYLDVFRTLNELGSFAQLTDGVIFHNTLASSDYGFLDHKTFEPRPNFYAVWLWNKLMGEDVYMTENGMKNLHIYCHSCKNKKEDCVYLIINNSLTDTVTAELPNGAEIYLLSADTLRSPHIRINGKNADNSFEIKPVIADRGAISIAPATCTFVVI